MNIMTIFVLAFINEGTVAYLFEKQAWAKKYLLYISMLTAIALSFAYQANIFSVLGLQIASVYLWVDWLVTGIVIGRGSNYLNTLVEVIRNFGQAKKAEAEAITGAVINVEGRPEPLG
jgi:hypothetical protein